MKRKSNSGVMVLESTYCIFISIIVIVFMLSFGFYLYQNTVVSIVATQAAEEVATSYKLRNIKDSSKVKAEDVGGVGKYRYLLFSSDFNRKNEARIKEYLDVRLAKTSLAEENGGAKVKIKNVTDDIGRHHYEIDVSQKYTFMLGGLLEFVGLNNSQVIEKKVYVESMDVLNYVNTVRTTKYGIGKISELTGLGGAMDSAIGAVKTMLELVSSIFSSDSQNTQGGFR